jgi:hypothetical protein
LKAKEQTSIGIVVSFEKSSEEGYKIVELRTVSSTVTVTTLASITRDGMRYIPPQDLIRMCELNGPLETGESMVIGGKTKRRKHEQS